MALQDWPFSLIGYPEHQRSGVPVIGVSHLSTHTALRLAESMGISGGWLQTEGVAGACLEGAESSEPTWAELAHMFLEQRVAYTEGMVSGSLRFVASTDAHEAVPQDRELCDWAEEQGRLWIEVIDNEYAYLGNLQIEQIDRLLCWYCAQRPVDQNWREHRIDKRLAGLLRDGLFEHGWTRNGALVQVARKAQVPLWGGIHEQCILDHDQCPSLSSVGLVVNAQLSGSKWSGKAKSQACPLNDVTGRLYGRPSVR